MKIPIVSKLNEKITKITSDLNSLGDSLVDVLGQANKNISESLLKSTEDIRKTSDNIVTSANTINDSLREATENIRGTTEDISQSADSMAESLVQVTGEIKETAQNIATSANSIAKAVENFTASTTNTIDRFESAIEKSIGRLVSTIEDFKNEVVNGGIKVNIAKSAGSLMPRPDGGLMQGITSGIRDMIIPKRKQKDDTE